MKTVKFRWVDSNGITQFAEYQWDDDVAASVAQLVGYDKNGHEVYEGDELTDNRADIYGDKVTAILQPYIRHEKICSQAEFFDRFWSKPLIEDWEVKLKENN